MAIPIKKFDDWILLIQNNENQKFHKENLDSFDLYLLFAAETLSYKLKKDEIDVEKFRVEYLYNSIEIDEPYSFSNQKKIEPVLVQSPINEVHQIKDEQNEVTQDGIQHS